MISETQVKNNLRGFTLLTINRHSSSVIGVFGNSFNHDVTKELIDAKRVSW